MWQIITLILLHPSPLTPRDHTIPEITPRTRVREGMERMGKKTSGVGRETSQADGVGDGYTTQAKKKRSVIKHLRSNFHDLSTNHQKKKPKKARCKMLSFYFGINYLSLDAVL